MSGRCVAPGCNKPVSDSHPPGCQCASRKGNPIKQLDEMERMARGVVDAADADIRFADETGNAHHVFNDEMLARAFLAVMPTVRAALEWHRVNTGQHTNGPQHTLAMRDTRRALVDAIDTLRRGMGEE